jgi:hypothetical protein
MKAKIKYWHKARIQNHFILELKIYDIDDKMKYKNFTKYEMICIDLRTGNKILFDNHYPKGPHIHINNIEIVYEFQNEDKLMNDFKELVFKHLGVRL